jgi:hypothetical protein
MKKQGSIKTSVKKTESTPAEKNKSTDVKNEDLPGYPHYPSSEDIMNSTEEKLGLDIENTEKPLVKNIRENTEPVEDEIGMRKGTSADVTKDELKNLGDDELAMDLGDDEDLKQRLFPVDMEAKDLVVPGAELDDVQEEAGNEDEENNFYSHADN